MSLSKLIAETNGSPGDDESSAEQKRRKSDKPAEVTPVESFSDKIRLKLVEKVGQSMSEAAMVEGEGSQEELRSKVSGELNALISSDNIPLDQQERQRIITEVTNDVLGYGPLETLLDDESVSEIMVNGPNAIYVERKGKLVLTDIHLRSEKQLRQIIDKIVSSIGRRVDESSPLVDARLADGSRVNAVIPPLAVDGSSLTIRKFAKEKLTASNLVELGAVTAPAMAFLKAAIEGRLNILVSGGTGSGKTTFLNILSSFIGDGDRIVTIEDAVELQLRQHHIVRLETRPPNIEGKGEIGTRELVKNSLRMRPDRIIIGECRGGEALDMLQAMNTGHEGSLTTLHANTPRDAIARLEVMIMYTGFDLPAKAIREQIGSAVDMICQLERLRDGRRVVSSITEITGMEGEMISMNEIFGLDREVEGKESLVASGVVPHVADKMSKYGSRIDPSWFNETPRGGLQ